MTNLDSAAHGVVVLIGLYLLVLAILAFAAPAQASRFLLGFAGSIRLHFLELALRLMAGAAFIWRAPSLRWSELFTVVGWVLVVTTLVLVVIPWRWHRRFAEKTVPQAVRHIRLIGLGSFIAGAFVLTAAIRV
jgi:uncharacterized protein YjeT (DUF2065 family)